MNLLDLPEEILIKILKSLDFYTQFSLYQTCTSLQKILSLYGVIKSCNLSQSTLATAQTLKHNLILSVSSHLQELILCALPDLSKNALLPIVKKLKCLKTLDVSYTNIVIPDLFDIHQACPTIKNISINVSFERSQNKVSIALLSKCQLLFSNFTNVSFVGSPINTIITKLPNYLLAKASSLVNVKLTVVKCDHADLLTCSNCKYHKAFDKIPRGHYQDLYQFHRLSLFLLDWTKKRRSFAEFVLHTFDFSKYLKPSFARTEYFIIQKGDNLRFIHVYVSTLFIGFFTQNFDNIIENIIAEDSHIENMKLKRNAVIMIWNKALTIFNESFFSEVLEEVRDFFPSHYESPMNDVNTITKKQDWHLLTVSTVTNLEPQPDLHEKETHLLMKKRRKAPTTYILNYDNMFKDHDKIKLSIQFLAITNIVSLSPCCEYLKKITFLSLTGLTYFSSDFFKVLFQNCLKLETLNIELSCSSYIGKSINFNSCLKNFRLEEKSINYNALIKGLCECPSLENIHLIDQASCHTDLSNICDIVEKNNKLYCLFVQAPMAETVKQKVLRRLKEAKSKFRRPYLNIEFCHDQTGCSYGPFVEVFNLYTLKCK